MRSYSRRTLGILATVAVFLQFFLQAMFIKALGILLVPVRDNLDADTWVMGSIFELVECVNDWLAPIAGPVGSAVGYRSAVMLGGIMVSMGFIASSLSSNVLQIALSLIILVGIGYSFAHVLPRAALAKHLDNRQFSLAAGIGKTGSSISLFILPPLVQLFLDEYGWRGAFLFVAAMSAHLVLCGSLLVPSPSCTNSSQGRGDYEPLADSQTLSSYPSRSSKHNIFCVLTSLWFVCVRVAKGFDVSVVKEYNFWVVAVLFVNARIAKSAWIIYFVPNAVAKGFSSNTAAAMVTGAGLGHLTGTVLVSVFLFKEKVTSVNALVVTVVLVATSLLIDPWMNSVYSLSINAVLFMAGNGAMWALNDVMLKETLGADRMASAYGWIGLLSGMFRLVAGFMPGWIYDHCGSYALAFIILGVIQISTLVPLLMKILKSKRS